MGVLNTGILYFLLIIMSIQSFIDQCGKGDLIDEKNNYDQISHERKHERRSSSNNNHNKNMKRKNWIEVDTPQCGALAFSVIAFLISHKLIEAYFEIVSGNLSQRYRLLLSELNRYTRRVRHRHYIKNMEYFGLECWPYERLSWTIKVFVCQ